MKQGYLNELSEEEIKMIGERLTDYVANPESGSSLEDVMERLRSSIKKEI